MEKEKYEFRKKILFCVIGLITLCIVVNATISIFYGKVETNIVVTEPIVHKYLVLDGRFSFENTDDLYYDSSLSGSFSFGCADYDDSALRGSFSFRNCASWKYVTGWGR